MNIDKLPGAVPTLRRAAALLDEHAATIKKILYSPRSGYWGPGAQALHEEHKVLALALRVLARRSTPQRKRQPARAGR